MADPDSFEIRDAISRDELVPREVVDLYREALESLVSWIDGWRDEIDGALEPRWNAGFKDTTPELVKAREALALASSRNEAS